jgi:hypothetical protein
MRAACKIGLIYNNQQVKLSTQRDFFENGCNLARLICHRTSHAYLAIISNYIEMTYQGSINIILLIYVCTHYYMSHHLSNHYSKLINL